MSCSESRSRDCAASGPNAAEQQRNNEASREDREGKVLSPEASVIQV